ncbi:bifunctional 4-hydroxy-2-oxoglutarate aldolase/2-dehydro-3-deoxy-phosphogluconate aldolase [Leifsonia shinshuensis]
MTSTHSLRSDPTALLRAHPLVAVLRAEHAALYGDVIDVLVDNGIDSIELTLSTPGTLEALPELLDRASAGCLIGVGTVTDVAEAMAAIEAGAAYLVTPVSNPGVIAHGKAADVPVIAGGLTPTELHSSWVAGAAAVKIFPAATVGTSYAGYLRGPFPQLEFVPSGGIPIDGIAEWFDSGALAVSLGGSLVGDALDGGSLRELAGRARRSVAFVPEWVRAR